MINSTEKAPRAKTHAKLAPELRPLGCCLIILTTNICLAFYSCQSTSWCLVSLCSHNSPLLWDDFLCQYFPAGNWDTIRDWLQTTQPVNVRPRRSGRVCKPDLLLLIAGIYEIGRFPTLTTARTCKVLSSSSTFTNIMLISTVTKTIPILWRRMLEFKKVRRFAQGHQWQLPESGFKSVLWLQNPFPTLPSGP